MDRNRESRRRNDEEQGSEFEERLVRVNRSSKTHAGGRTFSFGSIMVVGDGKGRVGVGLGKAGEVPDAIRKGTEAAKKSLITVPLDGGTIPHEVEATFGASRVLLKPASPGTGVIAGGAVRAVVESAGIRDLLSKSLGNNNPVNVVRATIIALQQLESEQAVAREMVKMVPHPVEGEFKALGFPVKLSATPQEIRLPPPLLNEHGHELREELVQKGLLPASALGEKA